MTEFRNAAYNSDGSIDMEINHPVFGWIPFTASDSDPEQHGVDLFNAAKDSAAAYNPPSYLEQVASLRVKKEAEIDRLRDEKIAAGLPYSFPDAAGTIQLRQETDLRNVQGVASSGQALMISGDTSTLLDFRDAENITHQLTGPEAVAMGLAVSAFISANYKAAWTHKDAVGDLSTLAEVSGYDYSGGWPA